MSSDQTQTSYKIDVSSLYQQHGHDKKIVENNYKLAINDSDLKIESLEVDFECQLHGTAYSVAAFGKLETQFSAICDRCLIPYLHQIKAEFEEEFSQEGQAESELEPSFEIDEFMKIDLFPLLRQSFYLELPMVFRCQRPDCHLALG